MRNETAAQSGRRCASGRVGPGVLAVLLFAVLALPQGASAATNKISTVAGGKIVKCHIDPNSDPDWPDWICDTDNGDGGPAIGALTNVPYGVAAMPDGGFVVSSLSNQDVRRVSPTGTITTLAGGSLNGFSGDGGPAKSARLNLPMGVAVQPDGGVLIADSNNHRIRRVSPTGTITTVAGNGTEGFSGDGGPATAATLDLPVDVAATRDGGFLIADYINDRIRKVSSTGTITTVAGTGAVGFSGDGGPASAAKLGYPGSVSATAEGGYLIADSSNNRVRRVSATGTITTVVGTGGWGFSGDGGPATNAQINSVEDVTQTPDGGLLIADTGNNRVRRVSPTGTIATVAGTGVFGAPFSGDGGLATLAGIDGPGGVAATPSGDFLIADTNHNRVRFVDADLR
jgi:hypothetical protein